MTEGHIIDQYLAVNYCKDDQDHLVHFLTHIETGMRTQDLTKIVSTTASMIFTSEPNAHILKYYFNYDHNIVPIELGKSYQVNTKNQNMFIFTCLKSYYNCGSIILIARGDFGTIIYTGYSAADVSVLRMPIIAEIIRQESITKLYLDCTYYNSYLEFFSISDIKKVMVHFFQTRKNPFYIHVPVFGLEDLLGYIAMSLEEMMVVDEKRMGLIYKLGLSKHFTTNSMKSRLFIISQEIMKRNIDNESSQLVYVKVVNELSNNANSYMSHGKIHFFTIYPHCTHKDCSDIIINSKPDYLFPLGRPDSKLDTDDVGNNVRKEPTGTKALLSSKGKSVNSSRRSNKVKRETAVADSNYYPSVRRNTRKRKSSTKAKAPIVRVKRNVGNSKGRRRKSSEEVSYLDQEIDLTERVLKESASTISLSGNFTFKSFNSCLPNKTERTKLASSTPQNNDEMEKKLNDVVSKIKLKYFVDKTADRTPETRLIGCQKQFTNVLNRSKNEIEKLVSKACFNDDENRSKSPSNEGSNDSNAVSEETDEYLNANKSINIADHPYARSSKFLTILRKRVPVSTSKTHGNITVLNSDYINNKVNPSTKSSKLAPDDEITDLSEMLDSRSQKCDDPSDFITKTSSEDVPSVLKCEETSSPAIDVPRKNVECKENDKKLMNIDTMVQSDIPSDSVGSSSSVKIALEIEGIVKSKLDIDKAKKRSSEEADKMSEENEPLTDGVHSVIATSSGSLNPLKMADYENTTAAQQVVKLQGNKKMVSLKSLPKEDPNFGRDEVRAFGDEPEHNILGGSNDLINEIPPNSDVDQNESLNTRKRDAYYSFDRINYPTLTCDRILERVKNSEYYRATRQPPPLMPIPKDFENDSEQLFKSSVPSSPPPNLKKMLKVAVLPFSPSKSDSQKTVCKLLKKETGNSVQKVYLTGKSLIIPSSLVLPHSAPKSSESSSNPPAEITRVKYIRVSKKKISNIITSLKDQIHGCSNDESCKVVSLSPKKETIDSVIELSDEDSCETTNDEKPSTSNSVNSDLQKNAMRFLLRNEEKPRVCDSERDGVSSDPISVATTSRLKVKRLSDLLSNPSSTQNAVYRDDDNIKEVSLSKEKSSSELILSQSSNFKTFSDEEIESARSCFDNVSNKSDASLNESVSSYDSERTVSAESSSSQIEVSNKRQELKIKPLSNLLPVPCSPEINISKPVEKPPDDEVEKDRTESSIEELNSPVCDDTARNEHPSDSSQESLDNMVSEFLKVKKQRRKRRKSVWFRNISKRRGFKWKSYAASILNKNRLKSLTDTESSHEESQLPEKEPVPLVYDDIVDMKNDKCKVAFNISDLMDKLKSCRTDLKLLKKFNIVEEPVVLLPTMKQSSYIYSDVKKCFVLKKSMQARRQKTTLPKSLNLPSKSEDILEPSSSDLPVSDSQLVMDSTRRASSPSEPNAISRKPQVKGVEFKTVSVPCLGSSAERTSPDFHGTNKSTPVILESNLDSSKNPSSLPFKQNDSFKQTSASPCLLRPEIGVNVKQPVINNSLSVLDNPFKLPRFGKTSFDDAQVARKSGTGSLIVTNKKVFYRRPSNSLSKDKKTIKPLIIPVSPKKLDLQPVQGSFIVVDVSKQQTATSKTDLKCAADSNIAMPLITGVVSLASEASSFDDKDPRAMTTGPNRESIFTSDVFQPDKSDQADLISSERLGQEPIVSSSIGSNSSRSKFSYKTGAISQMRKLNLRTDKNSSLFSRKASRRGKSNTNVDSSKNYSPLKRNKKTSLSLDSELQLLAQDLFEF